MAGIGEMVTGSGARKQRSLAEAAQNEQRTRFADEKSRIDAIEAGQRAVLGIGGGGLLSFVDDKIGKGKLKETLG